MESMESDTQDTGKKWSRYNEIGECYNHERNVGTKDADKMKSDVVCERNFYTRDVNKLENDVGLRPDHITEDMHAYWVKVRSEQNWNVEAGIEKSIKYDGKQKHCFAK